MLLVLNLSEIDTCLQQYAQNTRKWSWIFIDLNIVEYHKSSLIRLTREVPSVTQAAAAPS